MAGVCVLSEWELLDLQQGAEPDCCNHRHVSRHVADEMTGKGQLEGNPHSPYRYSIAERVGWKRIFLREAFDEKNARVIRRADHRFDGTPPHQRIRSTSKEKRQRLIPAGARRDKVKSELPRQKNKDESLEDVSPYGGEKLIAS